MWCKSFLRYECDMDSLCHANSPYDTISSSDTNYPSTNIFLVSKQHWCGMPEEWVHWLALTTTISSPNRASSKDFPPTTIWGINLYPFSIKPHPYESPAEGCVDAATAGPVQARMTRKLRSHHRVSLLNAKHMVGSLLLVDTVIFVSR